MLSGRPIIVTDAGFYRELPDDLVFKVDPTSELSSLTSQLTRLALDPALRATVGAQAAAWAKTAFSVDSLCRSPRTIPGGGRATETYATCRCPFRANFFRPRLAAERPSRGAAGNYIGGFVHQEQRWQNPTNQDPGGFEKYARPACTAHQPGHPEQETMTLSLPHAGRDCRVSATHRPDYQSPPAIGVVPFA